MGEAKHGCSGNGGGAILKATLSAKPEHAKSRLEGKRTFGALIVKGRADSVVAANILCRETGTIPGVAL